MSVPLLLLICRQNLCIGTLLTEKDIAKAEKKAAEVAAKGSKGSESAEEKSTEGGTSSVAEGLESGAGQRKETGEEEKASDRVAQLQDLSATGRDMLSRSDSDIVSNSE